VTVRVASLVPSGKADHTLLIPPDPVSPEYQEQSYHTKAQRTLLGSFVCYVLALLCIGWYALEAYKAKKRAQKGIQRRRDELLAERIRGLLGASQTGPDSVYVEETGTLFRQYLVEKYGVPTDPFGGTGEVYFESIKKRLPEHLADTIHFLLKEIDTVLALELDPYPGLERFKDDMMKVVE
jgi:hypothetical protein